MKKLGVYHACIAFFQEIPWKQGDIFLLALSGGKDSMALLTAMVQLLGEVIPSGSLAVAHFNHQSRGEDSENDAKFVENYIKSLEIEGTIPFFLGSGAVEQQAKARHQSFEATAREMRYEFLEEVANSLEKKHNKTCYILTAHHLQDNVETFLLNLARGSGSKGLCGIPKQRGKILRPLLQVSLEEIHQFLQEENVPHCEDSSNQDRKYRRNRVRLDVIPSLEEVNSAFLPHVSKTMTRLQEENEFLDAYVAEKILFEKVNQGISVDIAPILALPPILQGRAMQYLTSILEPCRILSANQRELLLKLVKSKCPSAKVSLTSLLQIERNYDKMIWFKEVKNQSALREEEILFLPLNQMIFWKEWEIELVECDDNTEKKENLAGYYCFHLKPQENLRGERGLTLRSRKEGDKLKCPNRPTKTVKKWCIDEKIAKSHRQNLPVLENGQGDVVAVLPFGVDEKFIPKSGEIIWKLKQKKRGSEENGTI